MKYSVERKEAMLKKMLPPNQQSIPQIAREEGISEAALYLWRKEARHQGRLLPDGDTRPEGWTTQDKFAAVVETLALNTTALAEYCRGRGLYPEQITAWRNICEQANDRQAENGQLLKDGLQAEKKRSKALERELHRKERALAETAALLVLRKKA